MFEWVVSVIGGWGYPGVFALMLLENLFPPITSEVIMPLAGYLVAQGKMALVPTLLAGTAGSVLGTSVWFVLGAWIGAPRLRRWAGRWGRWLTVAPADIDAAQGWFDRKGGIAVFLGRMIPAVRTLISVPAGVAGMGWLRFLGWTILGSLLWTGLLAAAGALLAANWARVADVIDPLSKIVVAAVVLVYLWRVVTWRAH